MFIAADFGLRPVYYSDLAETKDQSVALILVSRESAIYAHIYAGGWLKPAGHTH